MHSKPKVVLAPADTARYQWYSFRWREGEGIPRLAREAGVTNREMVHRIALAHGVRRISREMRAWKRECNQRRKERGRQPKAD